MASVEDSSFCLDTTVLVDSLRGRRQTVDFIRELESRSVNLATTTVNSFELYYGAYRSEKKQIGVNAVGQLLRRLMVLELSENASEDAGKTMALLEQSGEPVEFRDVLIGSIAKVHQFALVTKNTEHFLKIPGLEVKEAP